MREGGLMHSEILDYEADGRLMKSCLYYDEAITQPRPGILVFPEAFGLNDHAHERARRLAELGYVALACDFHGNGVVHSDHRHIMSELEQLANAPERTRARARGGFEALSACLQVDPDRIGAIGFCFGGTTALELARSGAPIAGVVGFHCGLATARPRDASNIKAKLLVLIGADDPAIPLEQRAAFESEMRAGGVDWQLKIFGGVVHGYTNPGIDKLGNPAVLRYDPLADGRSWSDMMAFFEEIFAG